MDRHLHAPGTAEMAVFVAQLILAGFILRAVQVLLVKLGKPWADKIAAALAFVHA